MVPPHMVSESHSEKQPTSPFKVPTGPESAMPHCTPMARMNVFAVASFSTICPMSASPLGLDSVPSSTLVSRLALASAGPRYLPTKVTKVEESQWQEG